MATAAQVVELAGTLKGMLRDDQATRIVAIAPNLSSDQLERLHAKLTELQAIQMSSMKHEIDVRQRMQSAYKAHQAHEKIDALKAAEVTERAEADAEADRLLEELNQL